MAISIKYNNGIIDCIISGCHCSGNGCNTNKCDILKVSEKFNVNRATPITRMFLHTSFGRQSNIDNIIYKFTQHFDEQNEDENGLNYMKKLILDDCEKDKTWKMCPICQTEYNEKIRKFENIIFIVPYLDACVEHKT